MITYFLSGLGADRRVFSKLVLPKSIKIKHIEWISNEPNESLKSYTERISTQIDTSKSFQLVGLSFGGIVATELSKICAPKQIIIISSISTSKQLPWYFASSAQMMVNPFIPRNFLKSANPLSFWFFGATTEDDKTMFKQVLDDSDSAFLKWAIEKIATWDNIVKADNLFHIHGTADKVFPVMFIKPDHIIEGGQHLMVYDKHEEISKVLTRQLNTK